MKERHRTPTVPMGAGRSRSRTGGALIYSLMVVAVVASLGAGLIRIQASITRRHVHSVDQKRALYIAEAGISEAYAAISVGKTGNVASEAEPATFANGVYWVEASEDAQGRIELKSTGLCGVGRFSISTVLQREVNPIGVTGVFGQDGVEVGAGSALDGYDSRAGTFDSQVDTTLPGRSTGAGARLSSNGDIDILGDLLPMTAPGGSNPGTTLSGTQDPRLGSVSGSTGLSSSSAPAPSSSTAVYGDARPGPQGIVSADPGVVITGTTSPLITPVWLPTISVPVIASSSGVLETRGWSPVTVTGTKRYDLLRAQSGGALVLQGPLTLVVDAFELQDTSRLVIDSSGGPVKIYVTGSMAFDSGASLESVAQDPMSVSLFIGDLGGTFAQRVADLESATGAPQLDRSGIEPTPLQFGAGGVFHGMIYSPYHELILPASLRILGAIAAKRVVFEEGSRFTYDLALATGGVGVETLPRILSWRIVALPDVPLVSLRIDPLATLAAGGITPTISNKSHLEQVLEMQYLDTFGLQQTYVGNEFAVIWSNVQVVLTVSWQDPGTSAMTAPTVPPGTLEGPGYMDLMSVF